jgi:hypothetical protein
MLPPVTDQEGNPLPLDQFSGPEDAMVDAPEEVRRAEVNVPNKGVHFNFEPFQQIAALAQAGRMDEAIAMRDALNPQARYVFLGRLDLPTFQYPAAGVSYSISPVHDNADCPRIRLPKIRCVSPCRPHSAPSPDSRIFSGECCV